MNFFKNFGIYGLVPVISKSIGFLLIPLYTSYLSVSEYGIQDIFTVFKKLAVFFIVLELYSGVGRYFYEYDKLEDRKKLISSAFNFQVITSIIVTAVLVIFHQNFYELLIGEEGFKTVYWIIVAWIPFAGFIGFFSVIVRYDSKAKQFLYITIFQLLVRLSITIYLIVKLNYGVLGIFIGHLSGSIIAAISYFILLKRYLYLTIAKEPILKVLKYSIPLIPGLLIMGVQPNITRYLIRTDLSSVEVGYFAFAMTLISFYAIIRIALRMAWQPFFFESAKKDPENLNERVIEIFNFFFYVLLCISIFVSLFSVEIVKLVAKPSYYESSKLIGLLSLPMALTIISEIAGIGINYAKKTNLKSRINILSVVIILGGLFLFLKPYGLMMVPWAFLLSAVVALFISMYYTNKFMAIKFLYLRYLILIVTVVLLNICMLEFPISITYKILFLVLMLFIVFFKRASIIGNIRKINSRG